MTLAILFLILFSLMLLIVIPDRWHARREIAKRQREYAESPEERADSGSHEYKTRRS